MVSDSAIINLIKLLQYIRLYLHVTDVGLCALAVLITILWYY